MTTGVLPGMEAGLDVRTRDAVDLLRRFEPREGYYLLDSGGKDRLAGRPDVIGHGCIVDYKSGAIVEHDESEQPETVKVGYVRQLRIYAYLVKENLGWSPEKGVLLPAVGPGVEVELDPACCEREASLAVALLDDYNARLRKASHPDELAAPDPQTCQWCPLKLMCPAFWRAAAPGWSAMLDGAAVEGEVAGVPQPVHGGAAFAVDLEILAGSEARRRERILPLSAAVHGVIETLRTGDHIRMAGLRVRSDGTLYPSTRTVIVRASDLPAISVSTQPPGARPR